MPANARVPIALAVAGAGVLTLVVTLAARPRRGRPSPQPVAVAVAETPRGPMVQPIRSPAPLPAAAPAPAAEPARDVAAAAARPVLPPRPHTARPKNVDSDSLEAQTALAERLESDLGLTAVTLPKPAAADCSVTVGSSPWADVWIDGEDTGKHTPVVQLAVACGRHVLELKRQDLRLEHLATVVLRAGVDLKARYQLEPAE